MVNHFFNMVLEETWKRPMLGGLSFKQLTQQQKEELENPFSIEEIEEALVDCDGNKSPGPDGFNLKFFKSFWSLFKDEVVTMFHEFHGSPWLPKAFTSYFLALIPKCESPQQALDFSPISLLGSLYKLIAKVLAARLKKVLPELISPNQSAFLKDRSMVDSALVLNEVADYAKKSNKECLFLKIDFQKAYDTVNWNFLLYMLDRLNFGFKWIEWMKCCICSSSLSILVNGSPTEEISIQRGLKQGDPLAPFLFLLVAEGLNGLVQKALSSSIISGFKVEVSALEVAILQYADNTILIGEADFKNVWAWKSILRSFELTVGLKVNFNKSSLFGVNVEDSFLEAVADFLYCNIGTLPFMYLGLPIGAEPRKSVTWEPLIGKIQKKTLLLETLLLIFGRKSGVN